MITPTLAAGAAALPPEGAFAPWGGPPALEPLLDVKGLRVSFGGKEVVHGIDFSAAEHRFTTRDIDFFLGAQFLVTVHPGVSRSIGKISAPPSICRCIGCSPNSKLVTTPKLPPPPRTAQ